MLETYYGVEKILYLVIAAIGVPVNFVAIVILSRGKCGLSTCTTYYLVSMATADLLVIITEVVLYQINYYYFPRCFLDITSVCRVVIVLTRVTVECSVWFTVIFTFDRFVAICWQKVKTKYCTAKTSAAVLASTSILICLKDIPIYFTRVTGEVVDNVPWFCNMIDGYYIEPGWVAFAWVDTILTPLLPFVITLFLNSMTVRHILIASRVRKVLKGEIKGKKRDDPEMESRRRSVILLFTISGSFILLWLTYVLEFLYYNIAGTAQNDSKYIFQQVGYLLQNFSCCTNTFIYGVTQSKFREELKRAVKYPATSVNQMIKNRIS